MPENIPLRLKELRAKVKLTQKEMAKQLNISHSLYSKLEVGGSRLQSPLAAKICRLFAVSESWLLEGKGTVPEKILPLPVKPEDDMLPSIELIEEVVSLSKNEELRKMAEKIAVEMKIPFTKALTILLNEKIK